MSYYYIDITKLTEVERAHIADIFRDEVVLEERPHVLLYFSIDAYPNCCGLQIVHNGGCWAYSTKEALLRAHAPPYLFSYGNAISALFDYPPARLIADRAPAGTLTRIVNALARCGGKGEMEQLVEFYNPNSGNNCRLYLLENK